MTVIIIPVIFITFSVGFAFGVITEIIIFQRDAINQGIAHYDPKTKEFKWGGWPKP